MSEPHKREFLKNRLAFSNELDFTGEVLDIKSDHPLFYEITRFWDEKPACLPLGNDGKIIKWISYGNSLEELNKSFIELNSWIFPSLGWFLKRGISSD